MPSRARKVCAHAGCPTLVTKGRCAKHGQEVQRTYDVARGTAKERGYDARWARYSKAYRRRNPLCVECERRGKVEPVRHVDHIVPVHGPDDPLFWDETNHQGLCHACHNAKTARERGDVPKR